MSRTSNAGQIVYNAVVDLTHAGKRAHRETIAELTSLRLTVVDNHLKTMKGDGRLKLVERGVYLAVPPPREERAVTTTILTDGMVKVEIGDAVMELSPREFRYLGVLAGGMAIQFAALPSK